MYPCTDTISEPWPNPALQLTASRARSLGFEGFPSALAAAECQAVGRQPSQLSRSTSLELLVLYDDQLSQATGVVMPLVDADLKQFCRTGILGSITVGMTKPQVEQALGIPQEWGGSWPGWSQEKQQIAAHFTLPYTEYPIWKYDAIEFHFGDGSGQLYLIWCDHLDQLIDEGQVFHLHRWIFGDPPPLHKDRCMAALHDAEMLFEDSVFPYGGRLRLSSGVALSYEIDNEQEIVAIEMYADQYAA